MIEKEADLKIIDIKPRGYCKGVVQALRLVKRIREENPETSISILGKIVHNRYITEALKHYKIKTIDFPGLTREEMLEYVDQGILILSAHGTGKKIVNLAKNKGLTVIDAVCNDVVSTHDLIGRALSKDKQIVYIGKNNHPETEAILQNFPQANLITQETDVVNLNLDSTKNILITNQTTLSILEIRNIIQAVLNKYPQAEVNNEICGATRVRQEAIIKQSNLDALIIVGDPNSNNTSMLAQIGLEHGIEHVIRIESIEDLKLERFKQGWRIGITSGASTPTYLTEMVSSYLKSVDLANPQRKPEIDLTKILE